VAESIESICGDNAKAIEMPSRARKYETGTLGKEMRPADDQAVAGEFSLGNGELLLSAQENRSQ
jgi:hypothetical protein